MRPCTHHRHVFSLDQSPPSLCGPHISPARVGPAWPRLPSCLGQAMTAISWRWTGGDGPSAAISSWGAAAWPSAMRPCRSAPWCGAHRPRPPGLGSEPKRPRRTTSIASSLRSPLAGKPRLCHLAAPARSNGSLLLLHLRRRSRTRPVGGNSLDRAGVQGRVLRASAASSARVALPGLGPRASRVGLSSAARRAATSGRPCLPRGRACPRVPHACRRSPRDARGLSLSFALPPCSLCAAPGAPPWTARRRRSPPWVAAGGRAAPRTFRPARPGRRRCMAFGLRLFLPCWKPLRKDRTHAELGRSA